MRKQKHTQYGKCPVEAALDIVAGKWKVVLLLLILGGTKRFGELQRLLPAITQRTLTNQLRNLERDGVIHREVYAEVPPRVEYSMTPFGATLEPVLRSLVVWAEAEVLPRLEASAGGE